MNHDLTDNDIFQALREGSEEAFGTLFRRYYPRLHRFACKYIADEAAASDAVQTCFMRLWGASLDACRRLFAVDALHNAAQRVPQQPQA